MLGAVSLLPEGFVVPPLPYLVGLLLATLVVGVLLALVAPPFRDWEVLAMGSWMAVGASLHALALVGAFPGWAVPLFRAPAVYVTTFVVVGLLWLVTTVGAAAGFFASIPRLLGVVGVTVTTILVSWLVFLALGSSDLTVDPVWPVIALGAAVTVAGLAFIALSLTYTEAVAETGKAGAFVVFAHSLDGVTTAIGVDVLCQGPIAACERSPVPRAIMGFAADLPTAQYVGAGWLFVLVKVLLALVVLALFADYVDEEPERGFLALTLVAAVGFGPGVYNLLLYLVSATPG